jgi:hypothetical protein
MRPLSLAALAAALAATASPLASPLAAQATAAAQPKVVACPDTIQIVSTQPGVETRFTIRGVVNGVALIASGVRAVRDDRGALTELLATTPAQLVIPQATLRLVVAPVDPGQSLRIERTGRDQAGHTQYLHAQGPSVAFARAGGTALQIVADRVAVRATP